MVRRLPPLIAFRTFEVAARNGSIAKAAAELNVTSAAVSQHIRTLEDYFDIALFNQPRRQLRLTEAGRACQPALREGFDKLAEAAAQITGLKAAGLLTVTTSASLATKWLIPRLGRFKEIYPDVDVRVDASQQFVDVTREEADLVIWFGPGDYPGLRTAHLMPERVFPVCSPALLDEIGPLDSPADLARHTLLHDEWYRYYIAEGRQFQETFPTWRLWLDAAGVPEIDANRGPRFGTSAMAIQAAVGGLGVTLGRSVLVADDLASGRLVKPFDLTYAMIFSYYVISSASIAEQPQTIAFNSWLQQEAKATLATVRAT